MPAELSPCLLCAKQICEVGKVLVPLQASSTRRPCGTRVVDVVAQQLAVCIRCYLKLEKKIHLKKTIIAWVPDLFTYKKFHNSIKEYLNVKKRNNFFFKCARAQFKSQNTGQKVSDAASRLPMLGCECVSRKHLYSDRHYKCKEAHLQIMPHQPLKAFQQLTTTQEYK
jgi:hypothetical protein